MKVICSRRQNGKASHPPLKRLKFIAALVANIAGLELPCGAVLAVNTVGPRIMRRINRDFLKHDYLTDVICFDYRDGASMDDGDVAVEIFISPDMAEIQATERPSERTPDSELLLYLIHGVLHATGELDSTPAQKRRMHRKEQMILTSLSQKGVTDIAEN